MRRAVIYTLLGSCRGHDIDLFDYFKDLFIRYHAKTFAALVNTRARRAADPSLLRRDYAFLFQRFFYYLEDCSALRM
jgi:hypothetical protein